MTDIASLGIEIKTDSVKKAADDLDNLNQKGKESEGAADKAGDAWSKAAAKISGDTSQIIKELQQLNARQDAAAQTFTKISTQIESASGAFQSAALAIGKFRDESAKVGVTASAVAPAVEKTTTVIDHQSEALTALAAKIDPLITAFGRLDFSALSTQISSASTSFQTAAFSIERYREELSKTATASTQIPASAAKVTKAIKDEGEALAELLGRIDPVVGALGRLDKMEESLRGFKSSGAIGAEDFGIYSQKIKDARDALSNADDQLKRTGVSAKQTAAALRMLPAQFTDIAVGLQAGQSPFTVLLQQGGQIKDSFGGIGPAFSAVGRYAVGLINPFTLAAAAVGALGLAYKQGSDEQTAFAKSLITTGNAAGTTTSELAGMAKAISATSGTTSQAADALNLFVASGKFAQDQLEGLATAAVAWESATGKAVSETVKEFARLADDPVKASQQLNEQYHYLTAAVYEQIAALQEQGRTNDAAQVAEKAYAEALDDRATKVKESLGTIETAWNAVKGAALSAWDAALNVGREETLDQRIERLKQQLQEVANLGSAGAQGRARFQLGLGLGGEGNMRQQLADAEAQKEQEAGEARWAAIKAQANKDSIDAQREISAMRESMLSKEQRRDKEIQQYYERVAKIREANPFTTLFSQSDIDKDIAGIRAKYAERVAKPQSAKAYTDDAATRMLQSLRETGAELQAQLGTQDKLTASQKAQAQFVQLISDLKGKSQLTADQKSLLANQDAIKAQLAKNVAIDQEIQKRQQLAQIQSYQDALDSKLDTEKQGYQQQLEGIGQGSELRERLRAQLRIQQDYQRDLARLQSQYNRGQIPEDQYREETELLKASLDDRLNAWDDYYKQLQDKQKDWTNGAKDAFKDYVAAAKNTAKSYYDLFQNALQGTEDALTKFVMTGKLGFKDLANSIIEDLVRIQVRQSIAYAVGGASGTGGLIGLLSGIGSTQNASSAASSLGYSTSGYAGAYGFDGGGYTGDLPRMGGVDGKGGFMAILHPQETVIDHTKPSRTQGGNSTSNTFHINVSGGGSERENKQAGATIGREINRVIQRSARYA